MVFSVLENTLTGFPCIPYIQLHTDGMTRAAVKRKRGLR